jgi:peptidoglycan hydrolase CwlO-like protein
VETSDLNSSSSMLVGLIFAIISISFGLQQLVKTWKNNSAEAGLLKIMQEELSRMNKQNSALSEEIGNLQQELIKLSQQLTNLTIENQKLQLEVSILNKEIARLHVLMSEPTRLGAR